jgi:hypothetical protein
MGKYLQKISLRPYSDTEIWTGWELEGRDDELDGLIRADDIPAFREFLGFYSEQRKKLKS